MHDLAVNVDHLTKIYKLYNKPTDRVKEALQPFSDRRYSRDFYALKDVSFHVKKGEVFGIIGKNGSGKSTLLKIITGVLNPTSGNLSIHGKVSALLELGTGFNPEYTGLENIYFFALMMGYAKEEIEKRMDDILAFADIGEFIRQPIKVYSTGMYLRLAFAVSTAIDPEILIIDEILAVGDAAFQRKCYSRIENFREKGVSILLVSHSAESIVELCEKVIWMDRGEVVLSGSPKFVTSRYHQILFSRKAFTQEMREQIKNEVVPSEQDTADASPPVLSAIDNKNFFPSGEEFYDPELIPRSTILYANHHDHGVRISNPRILNSEEKIVNNLVFGKTYRYSYDVQFSQEHHHVRFAMLIKTVTGFALGGSMSSVQREAITTVPSAALVHISFDFKCLLHPGEYFLNSGVVGFIDESENFLDRMIDAYAFRVQPVDTFRGTGVVSFLIEPSITIED